MIWDSKNLHLNILIARTYVPETKKCSDSTRFFHGPYGEEFNESVYRLKVDGR